ncbi:MAG: hypothetical protein ACPKM1_17690 [Spirochaetaceae bacterium]
MGGRVPCGAMLSAKLLKAGPASPASGSLTVFLRQPYAPPAPAGYRSHHSRFFRPFNIFLTGLIQNLMI